MLPFALTIFSGAFLLFAVQPLLGKYILPWFGGGPGVWTTCLLFFQALLLGGYAYAHLSVRYLKPRAQAILHVVLLVAALALMPIIPGVQWKPTDVGKPVMQILALLVATVGLPYFVLSATGPLLQAWFSQVRPGVSPYRLYALSNVGSLLALVAYPFLFEPSLARQSQAVWWGWGLAIYAVMCGVCAWQVAHNKAGATATVGTGSGSGAEVDQPPTLGTRALWLLLPLCASVMLLAVTNKICQDVAVIPFLWVLPLSLYLLSFIICFDHSRWYWRPFFSCAMVLSLAAVTYVLYQGHGAGLNRQICVYAGALFICCMVCHGEVYRLKPHPSRLTSYFLTISAGGALGGLFVAVVAPQIFNNFLELHLSLWGCAFLLLVVCLVQESMAIAAGAAVGILILLFASPFESVSLMSIHPSEWSVTFREEFKTRWYWWVVAFVTLLVCFADVSTWRIRFRTRGWKFATLFQIGFPRKPVLTTWALRVWICLMLATAMLSAALWRQIRHGEEDAIERHRNFYGVLTVFEYYKDDPDMHYFLLQHGKITHGLQLVSPDKRKIPTTYYGEKSGPGLMFAHFPRETERRYGVVGLGTGTLAAFGKKGDYVRIYEINPQVRELSGPAGSRFSYVKDSEATVEVAMGDARLTMEKDEPQNFDFLLLDAFSSDAIPVHLLTKEAIAIYKRHMKPDGVIAIHVSNRYLDLEPIVFKLADEFHYKTAMISDDTEPEWYYYSSTWILLTNNQEFLDKEQISSATSKPERDPKTVRLWTDDYTALFEILKK